MRPRRSAPSSGISHSINCGHSTRPCVSVRRRHPLRPMPSGRNPSRRRSRSALTWAKCFRSSRCPVAEPELPSLSGSGPEPESGFIAPQAGLPVAEPGAAFSDCDTAAAETVAESVQDSVPADGQEPAGGVAEPAEIPAEPAAGRTAEAELPVAGLVPDPETPAAEEIPAPESTGNSAGKEVPAENIAAASESHGDSGSQEFARVPGASGPQGVTDPRDEPGTPGSTLGDARTGSNCRIRGGNGRYPPGSRSGGASCGSAAADRADLVRHRRGDPAPPP